MVRADKPKKVTTVDPWWVHLHGWAEPLSLPVFLVLIMPAIAMAIESLSYAITVTTCFCLAKLTGYIDRKKPWAAKAYIASFALQVITMVVAIRYLYLVHHV
jgi:hypothetical protein